MNNSQCLPLVSFCILTYNQEKYIEEAIRGALSQEYENLEIIVSDDCSSDRTYEIAKGIIDEYSGPHKVILNRNEPNLGIREHCNKVLYEIAKGDYILLAGGDDISAPKRTSTYVDLFMRYPQVASISCLSEEVAEDLSLLQDLCFDTDWDNSVSIYTFNDYANFSNFIIYSGDSRGLRRDVITKFPKLKYPKAEDIYLFYRSLLLGSGCYIRTPLVKRRHHGSNESSVRTTRETLENNYKQLKADTDWAYEKKYINEKKYDLAKKKVLSINSFFKYYSTSLFYSPTVFFYRVLRRLFKVSKY